MSSVTWKDDLDLDQNYLRNACKSPASNTAYLALRSSHCRNTCRPAHMTTNFFFFVWRKLTVIVYSAVSLGGNAHRILLQNEPIFTKFQENTHSEGKQIWIFSSLIIFSVLGRWYFRATIPILSTLYKWIGIKLCK